MPFRHLRLLFASLAPLAALCFGLGGVSAQEPGPQLAITSVDAAAYPSISAVVTALGADGLPAQGLTAAQFQAFEGDKPLTVSGVQVAQDSALRLSVVVVIDTSGSMEGAALASAKQAAAEFVQKLGPNDEVALFAFSGDVRTILPFTADKAALTTAIGALQALGPTALYDATQTAAFAASAAASPRRAIVFLSDGANDSQSPSTADGSLAVARQARVPVYSIGFGAAPDVSYLQALADATNGQYQAADAANIGAVYDAIVTRLRNQYVLALTAPGPGDGATADLRIVGAIPGGEATGTAQFTRGVVAPAPTPAPSESAAATNEGGGGGNGRLIFGGAVVAMMMAIGAAVFFSVLQRTRTKRKQLAAVSSNVRTSKAQGVPQRAASALVEGEDGLGRLIVVDGDEPGRAFDFASTPLRIGSAPECEVRLPQGADVAPQHALVWMKDGKIMLRHVGGVRRRTLSNGQPVAWIILEPGDEFTVGANRYRAELRA